MNLLMDLEDNYEILFTKYIEDYLWILKLSNTVKTNDEDKKFTNHEMVKLIENESSKKKKDELVISGRSYEIAFIRAKRFFPKLDNYDYLKKSYLDIIFHKNIDEINIKLTDMDAEEVAKGYFNELSKNKENAIKEITKLRQIL